MTEKVSEFITVRDWAADHGGDAFRTFSALEWFIRRHRAELVESGQLILRKGQGGSLVGPRFGELTLEILRRESRLALGRGVAA